MWKHLTLRSRLAPTFAAVFAVVAVAGMVLAGLTGCGPSDLSKAYTPFVTTVTPLLQKEAAFWSQLAERANDQGDARGVAAYRRQLEEQGLKYYADLEASLLALEPGHERMAAARGEMVEYARGRREFITLELRRIELAPKLDALATVVQTQAAMDAARSAYASVIGEEAPDHRLSEVVAIRDGFLSGAYSKAIEGKGEVSAAVDALEKSVLPSIRAIRDSRYDSDERSKAFRRFVVATEEFFQALAANVTVVIPAARSAKRSEAVLGEVDAHRTQFQKLLADAKRDM
ncbi:MAG: hypothetical protein K8T90_14560 [Planctomycetes bacterium]|nr:hypothetical protein [Planctomycetota bacterium]